MDKILYVLNVINDLDYQPDIVGIFESEQDAKNVIERIKQNENSEIEHAWLEIKSYKLNDIDEDAINYCNLFL